MQLSHQVIFGVCGRMGSGKSTFSRLLGDRLNYKTISFGGYVKKIVEQRGETPTREMLQSAGAELIQAGLPEFCADVLDHYGWKPGEGAIVDGVRSVEALNALRSTVSPMPLKLVFVAVSDVAQEQRLFAREGLTREQINQYERHTTEVDVCTRLAALADFVVDGEKPVEDIVSATIRSL